MSTHELLLQYEDRIVALQAGLDQAQLHINLSTGVMILACGLFLVLGLMAFRQQVSLVWPSLPVPLAAVCAVRHQRSRNLRAQLVRLRHFYRRAIERMRGNWMNDGPTGVEFEEQDHLYTAGLNVFGDGSLFQLLCTARTAIGQRGLARYLNQVPGFDEAVARQEAVRELSGHPALRERVALLGASDFAESHWQTFSGWLDSPRLIFPRPLQWLIFVTTSLLAVFVVVGLAGLLPWTAAAAWIASLIAFHAVVGLSFRKQVQRTLASLASVSLEIGVLREGLQLLSEHPFHSAKLRDVARRTRGSAQALRKLERLLNALNERNKEWFYGPSLYLMLATQLCMAIDNWRAVHQHLLPEWIDAWGEFEALNALANYAHENPENTYPELAQSQNQFVAAALGHPLLPAATCVANDVRLDQDSRFYVMSGSNMSGKSTLLRAIGLNALLAFCGAPVRAKALRLSPLSICASLSIGDSLLNGKSKFLAEIDQLRRTIEAAMRGEPVIFLIDEIFSGTNSPDRRVAAEAVVRTLMNHGAIGVLSTHDLALTEIASLGGINVHTGSRDGSDPLDFDYLLKPGVTNETNALVIARMAGVPVYFSE